MRTLKTIGVIGSAAAVLLSVNIAFAEGRPGNLGRNADDIRPATTTATTTWANLGETARERIQAANERMQKAREEAQTRVTAMREKMAARFAEIQDKVKQQLAKRLTTQFDDLNKTWTDHFMQLLDRYDAIVQKMQDRASLAASAGKDVTAATTAIQAAKTAITTARTAVTAQAAKTYAPDASAVATSTAATTTPSAQEDLIKKLRTSFQNLHKTLFNDLFALRDGPMTAARKAVQAALQALGQVPGIDQVAAATSTPASNQ